MRITKNLDLVTQDTISLNFEFQRGQLEKMDANLQSRYSVCPLDRPDTCSLEVSVREDQLIKVRGSSVNPYTDGVICNKVARSYPEMVHGNLRLTTPLKHTGTRGSGRFVAITWNEALDEVYEGFSRAIDRFGPQSVMPFNYAGPHGELAGGSMDRRFFHKLGATLLNRATAMRCGARNSLFEPVRCGTRNATGASDSF